METLKDILDSGQEISKGNGKVVNWDRFGDNKEKVLALEVYRKKTEDTKFRTTYKLFHSDTNEPTGLFVAIRKNPKTTMTPGGFEIAV